jgi:hypothetical protein
LGRPAKRRPKLCACTLPRWPKLRGRGLSKADRTQTSAGESRSTLVIPGRTQAAKPLKCEPGISMCLARSETPMLRFRVRVRQVPAAPRNDNLWQGLAKHFFLSSVDNIPTWIIFPSVLPHREGRSRSSRSRGGMRWTPEMRRHAVHGGTSVFGQDGSAPALPLARRRPAFGWTDPWTV